MLKLILAVITGTLLAWFLVFRLMNSTDHMPNTFTIDNTQYLNRDAEGKEDDDNEEAVLTVEAVAPSRQAQTQTPASQRQGQNQEDDGPQRPGSEADQQGLTINSTELAKEKGEDDALEPLDNLNNLQGNDEEELDPDAEIVGDGEEEVIEGEADVGDLSDEEQEAAQRGDSDADMQARGRVEAEENVSATKPEADNRGRPRNNRNNNERKKQDVVEALDVAYALPAETDCVLPDNSYPKVGILYRPDSFAIKGQSLSNVDQLVRLYRKCSGGKLIVLQNETDEENLDDRLIQLRQDEIKYYLLQRRISKDDIILPDES